MHTRIIARPSDTVASSSARRNHAKLHKQSLDTHLSTNPTVRRRRKQVASTSNSRARGKRVAVGGHRDRPIRNRPYLSQAAPRPTDRQLQNDPVPASSQTAQMSRSSAASGGADDSGLPATCLHLDGLDPRTPYTIQQVITNPLPLYKHYSQNADISSACRPSDLDVDNMPLPKLMDAHWLDQTTEEVHQAFERKWPSARQREYEALFEARRVRELERAEAAWQGYMDTLVDFDQTGSSPAPSAADDEVWPSPALVLDTDRCPSIHCPLAMPGENDAIAIKDADLSPTSDIPDSCNSLGIEIDFGSAYYQRTAARFLSLTKTRTSDSPDRFLPYPDPTPGPPCRVTEDASPLSTADYSTDLIGVSTPTSESLLPITGTGDAWLRSPSSHSGDGDGLISYIDELGILQVQRECDVALPSIEKDSTDDAAGCGAQTYSGQYSV